MPPKWQPALRHLPNALSLFRLIAGPAMVAASWETRPGIAFCAMFVLGGLSDGADGYLARKYDLCSVLGAELDGRADTAFYSAMVVVSLRWYATELQAQVPLILATVLSHLLQWAVAHAKFGRLAAYHSVTGKMWGCSLFFACLMLFASDGRKAPGCAWLACAPGLLNNAHEIAMSCVLDRWTPEVPHDRLGSPATAPPATVRIRSDAADRLRVGADGAGARGTVCFPSHECRLRRGRVVAAGLAASGRRGAGRRLDDFPLRPDGLRLPPRTDLDAPPQSVRHRPRECRGRRRGAVGTARAGGFGGGPLRGGDRVENAAAGNFPSCAFASGIFSVPGS